MNYAIYYLQQEMYKLKLYGKMLSENPIEDPDLSDDFNKHLLLNLGERINQIEKSIVILSKEI